MTHTYPYRRLDTVITDGLHFAPLATGQWHTIATFARDRDGLHTITTTDGAVLHLHGTDTVQINA